MIRVASWPEVAPLMAVLDGPDCPLAWYAREVEASALKVYGVELDGRLVAAFLWRAEIAQWGVEFVIVAAAGEAAQGRDLVATVLPEIEAIARDAGCRSLRFHTDRSGLAVKTQRQGYQLTECVYRKRLT